MSENKPDKVNWKDLYDHCRYMVKIAEAQDRLLIRNARRNVIKQ